MTFARGIRNGAIWIPRVRPMRWCSWPEDPCPGDSAESPESSGSGHLVMVHVDESALCGKGGASDLPIKTVKRLLCDGPAVGIVEDGNGEPLSIGRS